MTSILSHGSRKATVPVLGRGLSQSWGGSTQTQWCGKDFLPAVPMESLLRACSQAPTKSLEGAHYVVMVEILATFDLLVYFQKERKKYYIPSIKKLNHHMEVSKKELKRFQLYIFRGRRHFLIIFPDGHLTWKVIGKTMVWKYSFTQNCIPVTLLTSLHISTIPAPSDCIIKQTGHRSLTPNIKKYTVQHFQDGLQDSTQIGPILKLVFNCFPRGHFGWWFQQATVWIQKKYWYKECFLLLCEIVSTTHSRNLQVFLFIWVYWSITVNRQAITSPCRFCIRLWQWMQWNKQMFSSWYLADWRNLVTLK